MAVRTQVPPSPRSPAAIAPQVDASAYVHAFSNLMGDVRIGANALIAPGTLIRAEEGFPFHIGAGSQVQDGVVIHGLDTGRVRGDDGSDYSVWIGRGTTIAHMALVHGPAYIGDRCFIGFRSTVFNARLGDGCIVMMHVLIQDVEVPPGKFVPSGAVITQQSQADQLPDVATADVGFANYVMEMNATLHAGDGAAALMPRAASSREQQQSSLAGQSSMNTYGYGQTSGLGADVVNHVRQLLAQGYRIGTEHADARRFQTSSWKSCAPIQATNESMVLRELEACLADHAGEYVRLIGIDPRAKRRVLETIIQRPDGPVIATSSNGHGTFASAPTHSRPMTASNGHGGGVPPEAIAQVRQLLNQGARIGTEHADKRRFQTSSWHSCAPIQSNRESEVIAALERCMADHAGEYVRMFGIDPNRKRRLSEVIIQRPNGNGNGTGRPAATASSYAAPTTYSSKAPSAAPGHVGLAGDVAQQLHQWAAQGYRIGLEYADKRRFQTSSWQTGGALPPGNPQSAIAQVEGFIAEHANDYVRVLASDANTKKKLADVIVHRPGQMVSGGGAAPRAAAPSRSAAPSYRAPAPSPAAMSGDVSAQVRQLLAQGCRVGLEYADKRRYQTSSWQTGPTIDASHESAVMSVVQGFLAEHARDYVRLIGIDPQAKRRVMETIIHKP